MMKTLLTQVGKALSWSWESFPQKLEKLPLDAESRKFPLEKKNGKLKLEILTIRSCFQSVAEGAYNQKLKTLFTGTGKASYRRRKSFPLKLRKILPEAGKAFSWIWKNFLLKLEKLVSGLEKLPIEAGKVSPWCRRISPLAESFPLKEGMVSLESRIGSQWTCKGFPMKVVKLHTEAEKVTHWSWQSFPLELEKLLIEK